MIRLRNITRFQSRFLSFNTPAESFQPLFLSVATITKDRKKSVLVWAGIWLLTTHETWGLICGPKAEKRCSVRMFRQLAAYTYPAPKSTHTHILSSSQENTVAAVFHLNEFLNLFAPSPLAAAFAVEDRKWRRRLPNRLMCQEGEGTKWSDKKETKREEKLRNGFGFQTWLPQKSSLVHSLFFTQSSGAALPPHVALY